MAYTPLTIASATPKHVKAVVQSLENHYFSDVHSMLRLPLPDQQVSAGCNFAITQVLAAVISGISVTLHQHPGRSGARFKRLVEDYYPWNLEPKNTVTPGAGAKVLYSLVRNPLTHDLGLDLENRKRGRKVILKRLAEQGRGLGEEMIVALEATDRPAWLSPTVRDSQVKTVVLVEALYWGVRHMIQRLTNDQARMKSAEAFLSRI